MRRSFPRVPRTVNVTEWIVGGVGAALAVTGLAHLVAPTTFVRISRPIFPDDTKMWVRVNGLSEAAIGGALVMRRTRLFGLVGSLVYLTYLADRASMAMTRWLKSSKAEAEDRSSDDDE